MSALIVSLLIILEATTECANIDSLKNEVNAARNNSKVDILNQISEIYLKSNMDSAVHYSKKAARYSSVIKYRTGEVTSLNNLAFAYYIKNKVDSAKFYASDALNLSRLIEYDLGKAQSLIILGLADWRIGAYPKAVDLYLEALEFAVSAENKIEISKIYNYLGLVYWKTGDYPKSIDYLFKSLKIKEELGDDYEAALTLNNLSNVHNEIGDHHQAILFAERALKISEQINSKYTLGRALGNLGISYLDMNQTDKALEYLNRSLLVKEESGEIKGLGYTLIDVGNIYSQIGKDSTALVYYKKAMRIMTDINDAHGLSIVLTKISRVELNEKNFDKALNLLNKSSEYAERENLKDNLKENFLIYSKIFEEQGKTTNALKYFKLYSELKDSLVNEKINSQIMELNINYETNQKEKEYELLKQENIIQSLELETQKQYNFFLLAAALLGTIIIGSIILRYRYLSKTKKMIEANNRKIEKHRTELEQLNATKDKFFSVLAHDLKNPFQTVLGFSNMLSTDYFQLSDDDKLKIVDQILNVSKSSYQLLENLLGWANKQTGRIEYLPAEYNLLEETNKSLEHVKMQAEQKFQKIDVQINPEFKIFTDSNIFSTIIRNLVTNAVKFSKVKDIILIDAYEKDDSIIVTVEDNGMGIPKDEISNLFVLKTSRNSKGTAAESGTGLGLVICKEFAEIYNGKIWVESEIGKGSKFYFTVPKA